MRVFWIIALLCVLGVSLFFLITNILKILNFDLAPAIYIASFSLVIFIGIFIVLCEYIRQGY